jgi:MFS family permease
MIMLAKAVGLRHFAFFSGMVSFASTLGNAIGPIVGGHLFDVSHSYSGALELGSVVALLAAPFTVVLPRLQFLAPHQAQAEAA